MLDLAAERVLALERGTEKIAVEIKGFGGISKITEFHAMLGQYENYRSALELRDPDRKLYLAIPDVLYDTFFSPNWCNIPSNETQSHYSCTTQTKR